MPKFAHSLGGLALSLGIRRLLRDRGFLVFVALSLGISSALLALAATFSSAILLRGLPFKHPEQLFTVSLAPLRSTLAAPQFQASLHAALALAEHTDAYTILMSASEPVQRVDGTTPIPIHVDRVAPDYITLTGLVIGSGQWPRVGHGEAAIHPDLARRLFGRAAAAVGQDLVVSGNLYKITAVLPDYYVRPVALDSQRGPTATGILIPVDMAPLLQHWAAADQGGDASLLGIGDAVARCAPLARTLADDPKFAHLPIQPRCEVIRSAILQRDDQAAMILLVATFILFLASLSGAALYAAMRFAQRGHEHFVIDMLGASDAQAALNRRVETGLLWGATVVVGLIVTVGGSAALDLDARWSALVSGTSMAAGLPALGLALFCVGLVLYWAPSLRQLLASRSGLGTDWRNRRSGSFSRREANLHRIVLVVEVAVGMLAVAVAATLMASSLQAFRNASGNAFAGKNGITLQLDPDVSAGARDAAVTALAQSVRELDGIGRVVRSNASPIDLIGTHFNFTMAVQGRVVQYELTAIAADRDYFDLFGYELRFGDWYHDDDPFAAVVTPEAQRAMVGSADPAALVDMLAPPPEYTSVWNDRIQITGGAAVRRVHTLAQASHAVAVKPIVFRPYHDELTDMVSHRVAWILFEGPKLDPETLNAVTAKLGPGVLRAESVDLAATLEKRLREHVLASASTALLAGAVLMSIVLGAFASMYSGCQQRRQEYGVRLALGADPALLRREFAARELWLPALAAGVFSMAAWLLLDDGWTMGPFPIRVSHLVAAGPVVFAAVMSGFVLAFRRFERQSPMEALRSEQ